MPKTSSINLRISQEFRDKIEALASYHGLTMSSYAHSLLVKAIRSEIEATPEAFSARRRGAVIASITSQKAEIQRSFEQGGLPLATSSKSKIPLITQKHTKAKRRA